MSDEVDPLDAGAVGNPAHANNASTTPPHSATAASMPALSARFSLIAVTPGRSHGA